MSETSYTGSERNCIIGGVGWLHENWVGAYYPEDMPEEWRLSFYVNDFNGVLLNDSDIESLFSNDTWQQDIETDFVVVVRQNTQAINEILEQLVSLVTSDAYIATNEGQLLDNKGQSVGRWANSSQQTSHCSLLIFDDYVPIDLKKTRKQLESMDATEQGHYLIFCQHQKGDVEMMQNIKTMTELMGMA